MVVTVTSRWRAVPDFHPAPEVSAGSARLLPEPESSNLSAGEDRRSAVERMDDPSRCSRSPRPTAVSGAEPEDRLALDIPASSVAG